MADETTPSDDGGHTDEEAGSEVPKTLLAAIEAVRDDPEDEESWDRLEDEAANAQRPDEVAELFKSVLSEEISVELANDIGQRATNFLEEWYGEESKALTQVLSRILQIDRACDWAFQRLTVAYTVSGRWDELLTLYDEAIKATEDPEQKQVYLDEAVNVAKDFAQEPDRAIGYLQQLLVLFPSDRRRMVPLERLLRKQDRWQDLVDLWVSRLEFLQVDEATAQRVRIATNCLDKLAAPEPALHQIEEVVETGKGDGEQIIEVLERISRWDSASTEVRRRSLELLKSQYEDVNSTSEVVRVIETMLDFATNEEKPDLHREAGERLITLERHERAMPHFASLLRLVPTAVDAYQRLRELAGRTGNSLAFSEALEEAAADCEQVETRVTLRLEAAKTRRMVLDDLDGSIALYFKVIGETEVKASASLQACRQLNTMLEAEGRNEEQLDVLERLAGEEPETSERRDVLGRAARLADTLGETDRALSLWDKRIEEDENDIEALSSSVSLLKRESRWEPLIEALIKRSKAPVSRRQSREDLVMVARLRAEKLGDINAAIETWSEVRESFGEDDETTNALADLYAQSSRWDEYATLLDGAAERESTHISGILARLGDVCRDQLSEPDRAIDFFSRSLRIDPDQSDALVGLRRMLEDRPERRGEVANILAAAYELTEKWDRVLELLEHRLEVAETSAAQARLLRDTATTQEQHLGNNSDSLRSLCRALVLTPWDDSLESEILRFGEDTQEWKLVVDSFNEAGEAAFEEVRRLHLKFEAGRLAEEHLDDPMVALDAYLAVLLRAPVRIDAALAVIRSAGAAGRWDRVAEAMLLTTGACDEFVPSVVDAMEAAATEAGDWSTLSNALEGALGVDEELPPALARQVDQLLAYWHEERRQDPEAAEIALSRAVGREGDDEGVLRSLAKLQRAHPDRELYDTLTALGDMRLGKKDLDPLHEAAKLALETIEDDDLTKEALRRLYREASRLWRRGIAAAGEGTAEGLARWALDELADTFINEEDYARAVALLVDGAQLPLIDAAAREMRRRAASLAAGPMGDNQRALVLYRSLVADTPDDEETLREFSNVCRASGLDLELLSLLKRGLSLCHEHDRRLELRLEISQLIGKFENLGGRLDVLTDNLHEHPGHGPSIDALIIVHEEIGRYAELADLLTSQARLLQKKKKTERAAGLWRKIATLSEDRLGDKERAIQGYRRVQKLVGSVESLDALARLQAERGEHASAARWLERRLQLTEGDERLVIYKQLATAYLADGQTDEATKRLESALELDPKAREVREHLATLYRDNNQGEPLAKLLTEAAPYVDDLETLRAYAHEAAELYSQLGSPDRSITVLEKASNLAPDDRSLRRMLAEGLIADERLDEASSILEELIGSYGRRRNPERAGAHFMLAKALKAQGDLDAALEQLDLAAKMDVRNPKIAALLGKLAVEAGQLERAERTYRALLMVVRRQPPKDEQSMGAAEVLFELCNLAKESDKEEQAQELLRSVLQTASQSAAESRRFRHAMMNRGQEELVLEALQLRVKSAEPGEELAAALNDLAGALETNSEQQAEALDARFEAIEQAPSGWEIHDAARKHALELGQSERYVKTLNSLIRSVRRKEETTVASLLLQRLGQTLEEDLTDYDGATKAYGKVESLGQHEVEARVSLARVAGARGDHDEEVRLLKALVADESLAESARSESRYRLAELQLEAPEKSAEGLATLEDALECDAFYERAAEILRVATSISDDPERLALYGRVARAAGNDDVLLDFLEKRLKRFDAELDEAKEAVDLLQQIEGETARLRTALRRSVEIAELTEEGIAGALWAPTGLAIVYYQTENLARSATWLAKAAEACTEESQAFDLWLSAASRAAEGEDHAQAVEIYERLLEGDASNRKIWEPALESARALADESRVTNLVNNTLAVLGDVSDRNAVRLQHAMFLLSHDGREPEAADVLQAVLVEEPGHSEATELLTKLYERIGYDEHLSDLLKTQLDVARDNQDLDQILDLSLKLGELFVKIRREDAMDVYRRALEWLPDNRDVSTRLLDLLGPDDDPRERVELMERPLKNEQGEDVAALAIQLADEWQALGEEVAVERVLKQGYEACPENEALRLRLEAWYGDRGDWQSMSNLMVSEATRLADPVESVTLLRNAATIYRESLNYQDGAIQCLAQARTYAPDDLELLSDLVEHRKSQGDFQTPLSEVSEVLERFDSSHPSRAELLSLRAGLSDVVGDIDAAVTDLEDAYSLDNSLVAPHLVNGLEQQRSSSAAQGDIEKERAATLRLVAVLLENEDRPRARETLGQWLDRSPQDRDALYHLLQLGEEEEQWQAVAETCERLVALEVGEDQVKMVLRLAEACDRTGIPENARSGLEHVYQEQPAVIEVRDRLWSLYETIGAKLELATMLVAEALANEDQEEKFSQLHRAGTLFLEAGDGGVEQAIAPLEEAVQIKPDDHGTTIMLIDAYTSTNRFAEAGKLLEQAIAARGSRRSPQLAELQYRMARLAAVAGDKQLQLQWLNVAFDSDRRNGDVVADLAHLAMELGDLDLALSALRVITVSKVESSLSRAAAFLMQAKIANKRGEQRRALMWAHRAHEEDPELVEAAELLERLGGGS